ncbi:uncharacterized protein BO97DRAFT_453893 [Aspergillus homomorphus CBS 101889]|uniref:Oxidase ustYa n=1 Tax=Aspergillus homomorphus (strain CBS 101889) TaxID=1450537 RepID=A0A395HY02_ASPHC|nr:hypothetical protein BO97DRAFT_453893 [Aspergillus homomorphus CBS 101889]RAL11738.1 hypothetical protein BO97DRAFT_453893 [Aspergillus homomorphus CBS 101889]
MSSKAEYEHRESDEYLLKPDQYVQQSHRSRRWAFLRPLIYVGVVIVGFVEIIVLSVYLVEMSRQPALRDLNGLVPDFPTHQVLFRLDPMAVSDHRTEKSKSATKENWLSYMPRGNGFIEVNHTEQLQYVLSPPIDKFGKNLYAVAVFHQMHCLYAIMAAYDDLVAGKSSMHKSRDAHEHDHFHHHENTDGDDLEGPHGHVNHCFQYLRESLLCCGDTALEGQGQRKQPGTDGTGAVHECKDFDAIMAWADERRIMDGKHP